MKIWLLTVCLSASATICKGQKLETSKNLICSYRFQFKTDSLFNNYLLDNQLLQTSPTLSRYESKGQLMADSLAAVFKAMPFNQSSADYYIQQRSKLPSIRTSFSVYKIKNTNSIRFYDKIGIKKYYYEEPNLLFNWKLLSTKSTINGYNCQMATTSFAGRAWVAWFTREIPVSEGPYKFYGLPGLIVKINDSKNNFIFELTGISQTLISFSLPKESENKKTTRQEFRRAREVQRLNGLNQMTTSGELTFNDKEKAAQLQRERISRPYNPLELK